MYYSHTTYSNNLKFKFENKKMYLIILRKNDTVLNALFFKWISIAIYCLFVKELISWVEVEGDYKGKISGKRHQL